MKIKAQDPLRFYMIRYYSSEFIFSSMKRGGLSDSVRILAQPWTGFSTLIRRPLTSDATIIVPCGSLVMNLESKGSPSLIVAPLYPTTLYYKNFKV